MGFSQKTCLPPSIAARRCAGRNAGGEASSTTSTPLLISRSPESSPMNLWSSAIRIWFAKSFLRCSSEESRRSWNASASATSTAPLSALSAWAAAPVPRPPQPTSPTLSSSLPPKTGMNGVAATAAVAFTNVRLVIVVMGVTSMSSVRLTGGLGHDPEADEGPVREPPGALGLLRIRLLPLVRGLASGGAREIRRIVAERAAARDRLEVRGRAPLEHVPVHVVQADRVRL